jgi:hypothetical protein
VRVRIIRGCGKVSSLCETYTSSRLNSPRSRLPLPPPLGEGDLLGRVARLLHAIILLSLGSDHPTKVALPLDQFSGADQEKSHAVSAEVFLNCSYLWGNANTIADSTLADIPTGDDPTGGSCP